MLYTKTHTTSTMTTKTQMVFSTTIWKAMKITLTMRITKMPWTFNKDLNYNEIDLHWELSQDVTKFR